MFKVGSFSRTHRILFTLDYCYFEFLKRKLCMFYCEKHSFDAIETSDIFDL